MNTLTTIVVLATVAELLYKAHGTCSHGDVQTTSNPTQIATAVQFCYQGTWRIICHSNKWEQEDANVVCNQLGYRNTDATAGSEQQTNSKPTLKNFECEGTERVLNECPYGIKTQNCNKRSTIQCLSADCTTGEIRLVDGPTNREGRVEVCMDGRWGTVCSENQQLITAVCTPLGFPGGVQLLGSYTPGISTPVYNCSLNTQTELTCTNEISCDHSRDLGVLCLSQEEIDQVINSNTLPTSSPDTTPCTCEDTPCPTIDSEPTTEAIHTGDTTTCPETTPCTCEDTTCPTCEPTSEVVHVDDTTSYPSTPCTCEDISCPSVSQASSSETVTTNNVDTNNCPPCTTLDSDYIRGSSAQENNTTIGSHSNSDNSDAVTAEDQQQITAEQCPKHSCVSTPVLGGVVGVLVTVLVVLVIGWSLSCVALVKRNSHSQKQTKFMGSSNNESSTERQLHNPVYDSNMETHNYSSSGPTYELVDTNEGAGQTYSVLEQCEENTSSTKPSKTTTEDEEHYYHVLESGECEGATEGVCDYEVPVSGQTNSRVWLCEEEYSTLQH